MKRMSGMIIWYWKLPSSYYISWDTKLPKKSWRLLKKIIFLSMAFDVIVIFFSIRNMFLFQYFKFDFPRNFIAMQRIKCEIIARLQAMTRFRLIKCIIHVCNFSFDQLSLQLTIANDVMAVIIKWLKRK